MNTIHRQQVITECAWARGPAITILIGVDPEDALGVVADGTMNGASVIRGTWDEINRASKPQPHSQGWLVIIPDGTDDDIGRACQYAAERDHPTVLIVRPEHREAVRQSNAWEVRSLVIDAGKAPSDGTVRPEGRVTQRDREFLAEFLDAMCHRLINDGPGVDLGSVSEVANALKLDADGDWVDLATKEAISADGWESRP